MQQIQSFLFVTLMASIVPIFLGAREIQYDTIYRSKECMVYVKSVISYERKVITHDHMCSFDYSMYDQQIIIKRGHHRDYIRISKPTHATDEHGRFVKVMDAPIDNIIIYEHQKLGKVIVGTCFGGGNRCTECSYLYSINGKKLYYSSSFALRRVRLEGVLAHQIKSATLIDNPLDSRKFTTSKNIEYIRRGNVYKVNQ